MKLSIRLSIWTQALADLLMGTKEVDYSVDLSLHVHNLLPHVRSFNKTRWLLGVRALLVGAVLAQKRRLFIGSTLKKFCTVKVAVKGRLSLKLVVSFVGEARIPWSNEHHA